MTDDRAVPLATAPNLRDLGTLPVAGGVVRTGVVYRSATLARLAGPDIDTFAGLGIRTVFDLRTAGERDGDPDALPAGTTHVPLDVLADSAMDVAASLGALTGNPDAAQAFLGDGKAVALLEESYRDIVRLPSAQAAYRTLFLALADPDRDGAALFHCTTGKDRTGWAAASLLLLLGADDDTVLSDYLRTNTDLLPSLRPLLARVAAAGIDPELLMPVLSVQESYLAAALAEVAARYGSIDAYAAVALGLDDTVRQALRERFVVSG